MRTLYIKLILTDNYEFCKWKFVDVTFNMTIFLYQNCIICTNVGNILFISRDYYSPFDHYLQNSLCLLPMIIPLQKPQKYGIICKVTSIGDFLMNYFLEFITNPYILTAVSSWVVAQVVKTIIYGLINRRLDLWRLVGDGGMPSGHSATVASLATICLLIHGPASFQFAISFILAIIVCHDATGVRQETGKQAVVINQIVELIGKISDHNIADDAKLKEFVGHTYAQVFAGVILGIINAILLHSFFFV